MCGSKARTNFPYDPINSSSSSSSKLLSATLAAKLHKCHMASLQVPNKKSHHEPRYTRFANNGGMAGKSSEKGNGREESQSNSQVQLKELEEDHVQQMIEELLDYGSMELCYVTST